MHDHPKHGSGVQEAQYNTPPVLGDDGIAGTSSDKGKAVTGNLPTSGSGDDDKTQANSDLLNAWMQRLQVLTIVTAFLATIDGELFSLTALNTQIGVPMNTTARELVYACLAGALIFHICATILGYVASFALIRYRIVDASSEEGTEVGGILSLGSGAARPPQRLSRSIVFEQVRPLNWVVTFLQSPERLLFRSATRRRFSLSPLSPPLSLLTRCYHTTLCLTTAGFILALTGILAYTWAGLQMTVGIFSTVCLGVGISAGLWAIAT